MDIFVVVSISVSDEDDVLSIVLLEMPFVADEILSVVDNSDPITVVTIDVSVEITSLFTEVADAVDNAAGSSVNITAVEDNDKYSLVDELTLDDDSVDAKKEVDTSVYGIVFSVLPILTVDDGNDVDSMVVGTVSDVIELLLD